jgi:hypothetical protein
MIVSHHILIMDDLRLLSDPSPSLLYSGGRRVHDDDVTPDTAIGEIYYTTS